jgi:molybdenum cofactor cytidylyltransferase
MCETMIGSVFCRTILGSGNRSLAKGHMISEDDARMLETEGTTKVWVAELEKGEIGEDDVCPGGRERHLLRFARDPANGRGTGKLVHYRDMLRPGGRRTSEVLQLLGQRCLHRHLAQLFPRQRRTGSGRCQRSCSECSAGSPVLQAWPIRTPFAPVLYKDPASGERARELFQPFGKESPVR